LWLRSAVHDERWQNQAHTGPESQLIPSEGRGEPAHWGANEIPEDIQRYSQKIGEQPHIVQLPTRAGAPRGTVATWGKVVLEPITGDELKALAEGKPLGEGIALDFIGDFARCARQGLPVYRLAGGAGSCGRLVTMKEGAALCGSRRSSFPPTQRFVRCAEAKLATFYKS
jgi:hypothetical protein